MKKLKKSHLLIICIVAGLGFLLLRPLRHVPSILPPDAILPDGGRYDGALVAGKFQGKGKIAWPNGARYEGGFDQGLFSGTGRYQAASGEIYEGNFKQGLFDGKGKLLGTDEQYSGEFRQGQFAGQGEQSFDSGRKYRGQFVRSRYQGKGRLEEGDGQVYEGDFDKGEFTGRGMYKNSDGSQHEGLFVKWQPQGLGKYTDAAGNVYEGSFAKGDLNGAGHWRGKNGNRYDGQFKNWRFHGQGHYRFANGNQYQGTFANNVFEGAGTYIYAKPQKDGRIKDAGIWHEGVLQGKEAKPVSFNVETALYNQRTLLDKAYAALAPRDPNRVNLYLLAVGGDGTQEVFRRETEFVRNQFDRDFGTRGRSMILTNSRTTVNTYPMATTTSLRESLNAIASRMDKDKDILFLYLTSHGSRKHEFMLGQQGMDLADLKAADLGKLLKESGIRWKVVVVSACYSGGFIPPLKDDNTLVITAARPDRTSFGCADENDFTYFGRAFFKESLPGSASFDDAFAKTKTLVTQWEDADSRDEAGKAGDAAAAAKHSEPQIHSPQKIRQQLQRWREQLPPTEKSADAVGSISGDAEPHRTGR